LIKKKVTFIITSLTIGGAEIMLLRLLHSLNRDLYEIQVVVLKSGGGLEKEVIEMGILLKTVEMTSAWGIFSGLFRLIRFLSSTKTDLAFCWMYHANLAGGIAAKITGIPVLWSVRHDFLDPKLIKSRTIFIARTSALLSHWIPEKIIFCSESSMKEHLKIGYDSKKSIVIPNGFDIKMFKPDSDSRLKFRHEHGIALNSLIVGHAGRFNPTKDHYTLIKAAELIGKKVKGVHFIFCGQEVDYQNKKLVDWLKDAGIEKQTQLLGEQNDMVDFYSSLDVFISSSVSESFPNVIGEAMSCAVPCVVTNVGDSALIVAETGIVVPISNPKALTDAAVKLLEDGGYRADMGKKARSRIIENYSIEQISRKYEQLL
jgi:glycosyltransferase involved in cell wall biosynthesis